VTGGVEHSLVGRAIRILSMETRPSQVSSATLIWVDVSGPAARTLGKASRSVAAGGRGVGQSGDLSEVMEEPAGPLPEDRSALAARMCWATCHPWPWVPSKRSTGTRTSSKKVSQNSSTPAMVSSGRTLMPGCHVHEEGADAARSGVRTSVRASTMQRRRGGPSWSRAFDPAAARLTVPLGGRAQRPEVTAASGSENP